MSVSEREDYDDTPRPTPSPTLVVPASLRRVGRCLILTWSWFLVETILIVILDIGFLNCLSAVPVVSLMFGLCLLVGGYLVYSGSDDLLIFQIIGLVLIGLSCGGFGAISGPAIYNDYQDNIWEGPTRTTMIIGWITTGFSVVFLILVLASITFSINHLISRTEHGGRVNPTQEKPTTTDEVPNAPE